MVEKLQKMRKNKKGFTLVELIVVLVILAILIALLVPALTGYIDKAKEKSVAADARMMLEAVQTEESDTYGSGESYTAHTTAISPNEDMIELAELTDKTFECTFKTNAKAKVTEMTFTMDDHTAKWDGTKWEIN